jgi:serine/threonine-protein kinase
MPEELGKTLEAPDLYAKTVLSGSGDARAVAPPKDTSLEGARYAMKRVLGVGGMGEVRLCDDAWIGRDVAMKVARPDAGSATAETRGRFLREARVQGQLEHPNVVPVYDIGRVGAETYFTMKRIGGHTLEQVVIGLRGRRADMRAKYNRRKLLSAMSQVCLTVAYAHSRGVIHRDLKPANVMLGDFGEVYVLDWGVAKLTAGEEPSAPAVNKAEEGAVTQAGVVMGTPGYMSPEQAAGDPVTASTDVYALGAILFELLALEPMNVGKTVNELVASTMRDAGAPSERAPSQGVPPELDAIVVRATDLDPKARFESARAMHEAIEAFLDGERDAERRRALATEHVKNARDALAKASEENNEDAEALRARGMRELGRAVALDPSDEGALRAISELVLAPATDLPASATKELARRERVERARGAGRAARMYVVWLGMLPLLYVMGVRSWPEVIALGALIVVTSAHAQWISMSPERATAQRLVGSMVLNAILVATCSLIFGPLVFVPGVAASSAAGYILAVREKSWLRALPFTLAMLAIFVPLALERTGVLPHAYSFDDGTIRVHPMIASFHETSTIVSLIIVTFVQLVLPSIILNRAVDDLVDAERRSFAQAWRLRQLLP